MTDLSHNWLIWSIQPDLIQDCLIWFMNMYLLHDLQGHFANTSTIDIYSSLIYHFHYFLSSFFSLHTVLFTITVSHTHSLSLSLAYFSSIYPFIRLLLGTNTHYLFTLFTWDISWVLIQMIMRCCRSKYWWWWSSSRSKSHLYCPASMENEA